MFTFLAAICQDMTSYSDVIFAFQPCSTYYATKLKNLFLSEFTHWPPSPSLELETMTQMIIHYSENSLGVCFWNLKWGVGRVRAALLQILLDLPLVVLRLPLQLLTFIMTKAKPQPDLDFEVLSVKAKSQVYCHSTTHSSDFWKAELPSITLDTNEGKHNKGCGLTTHKGQSTSVS